jgi:hypothetical protein
MRIVCDALGGEHHGDVYIADKVGEPFSMTGVGKAGEVEGVLVSGPCNDGIDFTTQRESDRSLDGVAGDAAGPDDTVTILVRVSAAEAPGTDRYSALCWNAGDLVFGTHDGDLCVDSMSECAACNLRTDPTGVAQCHGYPRS